MAKDSEERIKDTARLDVEMAEGKTPEIVAEIYREGDKYYCAECRSELPVRQACPVCRKKPDWDRFLNEIRS